MTALGAALLSGVVACSRILGIDFPPLAEDAGTLEAAVPDAADSYDAARPCPIETIVSTCSSDCPHAFCDDFDDLDDGGFPTAAGARHRRSRKSHSSWALATLGT